MPIRRPESLSGRAHGHASLARRHCRVRIVGHLRNSRAPMATAASGQRFRPPVPTHRTRGLTIYLTFPITFITCDAMLPWLRLRPCRGCPSCPGSGWLHGRGSGKLAMPPGATRDARDGGGGPARRSGRALPATPRGTTAHPSSASRSPSALRTRTWSSTTARSRRLVDTACGDRTLVAVARRPDVPGSYYFLEGYNATVVPMLARTGDVDLANYREFVRDSVRDSP